MRILLNDAELDAMSQWPYRDRALYLALRQRMDFKSRTVGIVVAVSWQALREDMEVRSGQGIAVADSGLPSLRELRVSVERMIASGAIQSLSEQRRLAFKLVFADGAESRPLEVRQSNGRPGAADIPQPQTRTDPSVERNYRDMDGIPASDEVRHTSVNRRKPFLTPLSSSLASVKQEQLDEDESVIPETPQTPMQWIRLMKSLGFTDSALSTGALAIYDAWLKAGLQVKQVQAAAAVAAKHNGRSVQYVAKVLDDAAKRNRKLSDAGFEESPGKPWWLSNSGIESRAIQHGITRMDDEQPHHFLMRVYQAAGLGEADIKLAFNGSPFQGR